MDNYNQSEIFLDVCTTGIVARSNPLEENYVTTNQLYADFDSYLHTKCIYVSSFADVMSTTPQILEQSTEMGVAMEESNSYKAAGVLSLTNKQQKKSQPKSTNIKVKSRNINHNLKRPDFAFSKLITMAINNSPTGWVLVADIYNYIRENFKYYETAPDNWKNSVRHALSMNKKFVKEEFLDRHKQRRCRWSLNPFQSKSRKL